MSQIAVKQSKNIIFAARIISFYIYMDSNCLSPLHKGVVGVQFLSVAFSAIVFVPLPAGFDPSTALFTAGIDTLLFHLVAKGRVPIFLSSSFALIAPIIKTTELYGFVGTLSGMVGVTLVYFVMSVLAKWQGIKLIERLFPPVITSSVIILIGFSLAGTRVNVAKENWIPALPSLLIAVVIFIRAKRLLRLIPIFCEIIVGYTAALVFCDVGLSGVRDAAWLGFPRLVFPKSSWESILFMMPVAIAPVIEHIGDVYVVNTVTGKDYVEGPGLHRTSLGDGLTCSCVGLLGGPPVTTYSEVTGAMSLTRMTSPQITRIAVATAILLPVTGKVSTLLKSIPSVVLRGIMLPLFGTIVCTGTVNLVNNYIDLSWTRNVIIVSLILTIGIGGAVLTWDEFSLSGIGLAALVGVGSNLALPKEEW